jgi:hypothetical protein
MTVIEKIEIHFMTDTIFRKGHGADYSSPSSTEVKNGGTVPPLSHISMVWYLIKHYQESSWG